MRTGVFGGTFNPVHFGHLRIAFEAAQMASLDRVIFMPCYLPPHKASAGVATADDRLNMLKLAIDDNPLFQVSEIELEKGGRSYSIETLSILKKTASFHGELFFIIGMDSFLELGDWKRYRELLSDVNFIVAARPGYMASLENKASVDLLPVDIREQFCYYSKPDLLKHKLGKEILFLETTLLDISSSALRHKIGADEPITYLTPAAVERYIKEEGLYSIQQTTP